MCGNCCIRRKQGSENAAMLSRESSLPQAGLPNQPGRKKNMNPFYRPMVATLVDGPVDDKRWVFETKWIRRASSPVSRCAAARRPDFFSK
jgi:hypothetical protein